MSEDVDEVGGGIRAEPGDGDPVGVAADKDKVGLGSELEKVRAD